VPCFGSRVELAALGRSFSETLAAVRFSRTAAIPEW
jgi:hypothetical protein